MLDGRPALIVDEEFLIALDLQRMLEEIGVGQVLLARNVAEARQLKPHWDTIAIAIVEMRDGDATRETLWRDIAAAGIPVVLITSDLPTARRDADTPPVVRKPIPERALASAVAEALAKRA